MNKVEEAALMQAHYPHIGSDAMSRNYLPYLTPKQIRHIAVKLKLRYTGPRLGGGKPWTPPEIAVLRRLYVIGGADAVQKELPHRTLLAIRNQAWLEKLTSGAGGGGPTRKDFFGVPVHDYTDADVVVRDWKRPADAPRLQLFGLVGVEMAA